MLEAPVTEAVPLHMTKEGVIRVGGTRVTLHTVISTFNAGASAEEIVRRYTSLKLADVYAVITYYLRHQDEIDEYLRDQERQADELRREIEARFPPEGIKERLLTRHTTLGRIECMSDSTIN